MCCTGWLRNECDMRCGGCWIRVETVPESAGKLFRFCEAKLGHSFMGQEAHGNRLNLRGLRGHLRAKITGTTL
jgi:hypothetical protein